MLKGYDSINRPIYIILFLFIFSACSRPVNNNNRDKNNVDSAASITSESGIHANNGFQIEQQDIVYDDTLANSKPLHFIQLILEDSFKKDTCLIHSGTKILFKGIITTNQITGLAKRINIDRLAMLSNTLLIQINSNSPVEVIGLKNYNYLRVKFIENEIRIKLTNKEEKYK